MKKSTQYKNEFINTNYDRINLTVPKGAKEQIRERAESLNLSVNSYINALIEKDLPSAGSKAKREKEAIDVFLL